MIRVGTPGSFINGPSRGILPCRRNSITIGTLIAPMMTIPSTMGWLPKIRWRGIWVGITLKAFPPSFVYLLTMAAVILLKYSLSTQGKAVPVSSGGAFSSIKITTVRPKPTNLDWQGLQYSWIVFIPLRPTVMASFGLPVSGLASTICLLMNPVSRCHGL